MNMNENKTVTIEMYLDKIDTIYQKNVGIKYYELTYRSVDGLYRMLEVTNASEIQERIIFTFTPNKMI